MNAVYKSVHNFRWAILPLSNRFLYILICRLWQTAVVLTFPRCLKHTCPCLLRRRLHCLWRSMAVLLCLYLCIEQISDTCSIKISSKRTGLNIFVEIQSISFAVSYSMKFKAFFLSFGVSLSSIKPWYSMYVTYLLYSAESWNYCHSLPHFLNHI